MRSRTNRDQQILFVAVGVTLVFCFFIVIFSRILVWDEVIVSGHNLADFVHTVEGINSMRSWHRINIQRVSLSGPPGVPASVRISNKQDVRNLLELAAEHPGQIKVNSFRVKGRTTYYQYGMFHKLGDVRDIRRYHLIPFLVHYSALGR